MRTAVISPSNWSPCGRGLQKFHKPAAEGGVPRGPLLACVDKLGSHIGKLGSECGDDQLVMIDDRLAIRGRLERRVGLDGMCGETSGWSPRGDGAPLISAVPLRVFGGSPSGQMLEAQWFMRG